MNKNLNLHLVQWRVIPGDVEENLRKAGELIAKAVPGERDLIVLPEMFPGGFFYGALDHMAGRSIRVLDWMSETARLYHSGLSGSLPVLTGDGIANRTIFMEKNGEILAGYDKIHLFPGTGEEKYFVAGNRAVTLLWEDMKIGLAVCFDLRFPEMARRLCEEGAEILVVSAQWPLERADHFRDFLRVRAMENQFFVAACNSCGEDSEGVFLGGGSTVVGPSGEVLGALGTDEGILSMKISPGDVERVRERFPVVKCRRDDVFGGR